MRAPRENRNPSELGNRRQLPDGAAGRPSLFRQVELTARAHREVEIRLADVVGRGGLVGVRRDCGEGEGGAFPTPPRYEQTSAEAGVEVHKPETIGDAIKHP